MLKIKTDNESQRALEPNALKVWLHPTVINVVEVLEVFSVEPGDGELAAWLILAFNELVDTLSCHKGASGQSQVQAMLEARDRSFEWLVQEIESAAYDPEPHKATDQVDRALNCALLLLCAQTLGRPVPSGVRDKSYTYLRYMSEQGWPRDSFLPFVASQLKKPGSLAADAKQYLLNRIEHWRSQADVRGMSLALLRCEDELTDPQVDELAAVIQARFCDSEVQPFEKAWALLALSQSGAVAKNTLDALADDLLDVLSQDRLLSNEITAAIRLIGQFPFSTPAEIDERVSVLREKGYRPARGIAKVSHKGVLVDVFAGSPGEPWSFALNATRVSFITYAILATGYHDIVGLPVHYRPELEESLKKYAELEAKKATTMPVSFIIWYNISAIIATLEIGGLVGALTAAIAGTDLRDGGLVGIGAAAVMFLSQVCARGPGVFGRELILIEIRDWLLTRLSFVLKLLGLK